MATVRQSVLRNFVKSLIAVIIGGAVYFLVIEPRLPLHARHQIFRFDLGLLINAWICLVTYGIIEFVLRWKKKPNRG